MRQRFTSTFTSAPAILRGSMKYTLICVLFIAPSLVFSANNSNLPYESSYWDAAPYLDTITTPGQCVEVPTTTTMVLNLRECIQISLDSNFDIQNSRRDLEIQYSYEREERAFFIPFVDFIGEVTYGKDRDRDDELERAENYNDSQEGRVEITQNLPTGGSLGVFTGVDRLYVADQPSVYTSQIGAVIEQPLLREGGFAVGLADLRTEELDTLSQVISLSLNERDLALEVIQRYFQILQAKLDLQVSRDALAEKERFLEEAQMKFELDEVPESEISRAEINYLQELERYNIKERTVHDRTEDLLIVMALPLDTNLEIVDITQYLIERGIPSLGDEDEYVKESLVLRPELRQRDIAISRGTITMQVAKNALLPRLDLNAETRSFQSDDYFRESRNLDYNTWAAGLLLEIPLPNIPRRESYRRSLLSLEKLKTNRLSLERDIIREVMRSFRTAKTNELSTAILLKTVEQSKKSLEQETSRFEFGLNTSVDVRLAQDDLFEAQSDYYTAILAHQVLIADLYRAVGRPLY